MGEVIGPAADGFIDVGGDVREIMMHAAARTVEGMFGSDVRLLA